MRTKQQSIRTPEDTTQSWGETQIIEVIREAYASNRSPEQLFRERSNRRGGLTGQHHARKTSITEKLSLVTVYRRQETFLRGFWRGLTGR